MRAKSLRVCAREALALRKRLGLLRLPRPVMQARTGRLFSQGRWRLNFASNDYLGLSQDPRLLRAAGDAFASYGWGAGASRLVSGTTGAHEELERSVARWQGHPKALLFSNGYMANLSVLTALVGPSDEIVADALNHASLIDACRLSRRRVEVYPHRDLCRLEATLRRLAGRRRTCWIVTDGVFSVDGDRAPLAGICELADRYGARVYVDEAHAVGVLGKQGRGVSDELNVAGRVDLVMGTFGKAFGGYGAFVAGPAEAIDLLYNAARPFVFTTALPAPICAADLEGLRISRKEEWRRDRLWENVRRVRQGLVRRGWDLMGSDTQIVPVFAGSLERLAQIRRRLERADVWIGALRPPTVAPGTCRLRLSVSAAHAARDIDVLLDAIGWNAECARSGRGRPTLRMAHGA